jgi:hypothetical protein
MNRRRTRTRSPAEPERRHCGHSRTGPAIVSAPSPIHRLRVTSRPLVTLCPIARAAGCRKCPVFRVCPVKSITGIHKSKQVASRPGSTGSLPRIQGQGSVSASRISAVQPRRMNAEQHPGRIGLRWILLGNAHDDGRSTGTPMGTRIGEKVTLAPDSSESAAARRCTHARP